jgi:dolichol kinase
MDSNTNPETQITYLDIIDTNDTNNTHGIIVDTDEINIDNQKNDNYILELICRNPYKLFLCNSAILFVSCIILSTLTVLYNDDLDKYFWINQVTKYIIVSIIQYFMALLVVYKNVKVNYTRKVIHVSYFMIPQLLDILLIKYEKNKYTEFWNVWIILFLLLLLSEPIRNKIVIIDTMFKAVDRPEDRPYTLIWFSSQIITTLAVIIPFSVYFSRIDKIGLVFIPILVNGLADGIAEPVGIRFGKHKYITRACLSRRKYERSYEGSLCVFLVSLIIILCYYGYMAIYQYIFCCLTIPIITTATEAYSPHTWDSPCIFFVVCGLLALSDFIPS